MKTICTFCIFLAGLLSASASKAQWSMVYSNPNINLTHIQFTSDLTGYALGSYVTDPVHTNALLLRTTNGGVSWTEIPLDAVISKMEFINDSTGYVIGGGAPGHIFYSTNGFNSWTSHDIAGDSFAAMDLHLVNDSSGIYILNEGRMGHFDHFGATSVLNDTLTDFFGFAGVTGDECYKLSYSQLWNTMNGGSSWNFVNAFYFQLMGGVFTSSQTGYLLTMNSLSGDRFISKTIDGGLNFNLSLQLQAQNITAAGNTIVAIDDTANIAWSNDAGNSWTYETTGAMPLVECHVALTPGRQCYFTNIGEGAIYKRGAFPPLSVNETIGKLHFSCYPNPAAEELNIKMATQPTSPVEYQVIDMTGRSLLEGQLNAGNLHVPLNAVPAGSYFIKLRAGNAMGTLKFGKL